MHFKYQILSFFQEKFKMGSNIIYFQIHKSANFTVSPRTAIYYSELTSLYINKNPKNIYLDGKIDNGSDTTALIGGVGEFKADGQLLMLVLPSSPQPPCMYVELLIPPPPSTPVPKLPTPLPVGDSMGCAGLGTVRSSGIGVVGVIPADKGISH